VIRRGNTENLKQYSMMVVHIMHVQSSLEYVVEVKNTPKQFRWRSLQATTS